MKNMSSIPAIVTILFVGASSVPAGDWLPHRPALLVQQPDHDHKDDQHKDDEHKGEKKDLGTQKIGGFSVQVMQIGEVKPGEEAIFIIMPKGQGQPKAVRAWVGIESGEGSIKTKADQEKEGEWHAHHQVSKPLPAKSSLWVELETNSGKQKGLFALKG
jgi:hypothetical protein